MAGGAQAWRLAAIVHCLAGGLALPAVAVLGELGGGTANCLAALAVWRSLSALIIYTASGREVNSLPCIVNSSMKERA